MENLKRKNKRGKERGEVKREKKIKKIQKSGKERELEGGLSNIFCNV
jgi:hypothetical protein